MRQYYAHTNSVFIKKNIILMTNGEKVVNANVLQTN